MAQGRGKTDYKSVLKLIKERLSRAVGMVPEPAPPPSRPPQDTPAPRAAIAEPAISSRVEERVPPASRPTTSQAPSRKQSARKALVRQRQKQRLRPPGAGSVRSSADPIDFGEFRVYTGPKPAPSNGEPASLKGTEALRHVKQHVSPSEIRVRPGPPPKASPTTTSRTIRTMGVGAEMLRVHPQPDPLGFIVGFDFGTSSSKIVVHQPGAGDLAYALPVPKELRASDAGRSQDHLWRSTVWFDSKSQRFSLTPRSGWTPVEGFKTGLIQSSGHRMDTANLTHAQAATAYLALMIAYVVGHHREAAPGGFSRKDHFSRFHFGVPVACKDEQGCAREFRRVFEAAFRAAPSARELDLEMIKAALATADPSHPESSDTPFVVFEELAAVIAGYRASPEKKVGPHMVVDVGASTLDVATFYVPEDADDEVPVYMSGVEILGAEALAAARRLGVPDATFQAACGAHTRHVWSNTFLKKNASFFPNNGVPKPLLFVGGGRLTDLHGPFYERYQNGLEAPLRTPKPGKNLSYDKKTDVERLLLAWGLSQEQIAIPELRPPSRIEEEVRRERDPTAGYVSKDMV